MASGSAAFYQASLVLIPALLFGGALREAGEEERKRRRKHPEDGGGKLLGLGLVFGLIAGLVAEGVAIRGAIEPPSVHELEQRYLAGVLTVGTAGLAIWVMAPILEKRRGWVRLTPPRVITALVAAVVLGQVVIGQSLERANTHAQVEAISKRQLESLRTLQAAEERNLIAREHLLDVAGEMKRQGRAVTFAQSLIDRLDQARASVKTSVTAPHVLARLHRAFETLNSVNQDLDGALAHHFPLGAFIEKEQFVVAERRLSSTMSLVMSSAANNVLAERDLRQLCGPPQARNSACNS